MPNNTPILVTGIHRSGSTWIGKILSEAPGVKYIHEPFNIEVEHYYCPFPHWYEYLRSDMDAGIQEQALRYIESFYKPGLYMGRLKKVRSPKQLYNFFYYSNTAFGSGRPLIKDPLALMSSQWLYEKLDCQVIISIRHPAAFAASLKVKKTWDHDFNHFLNQAELMKDYLGDFKEEIRQYADKQPDIISQACLLWNIIYTTVADFQKKYQDQWHFIKHEDLSMDPVSCFDDLFQELHIEFTDQARQNLIESTTAKEAGELKRDSRENIKSWKKRLTTEEIDFVKEATKKVWPQFYTEEDWQ